MRTAQLLATFAAATAVLFTAACGGDDPAPTSAQNGAAAGGLTFDAVAKLASERLTKDPNCPIGKWDDNSTGLDDAFKADGVFFKQFDCYKTADELLPNRIQQVIFVEFKTPERAAAYADKQATLYPSLVAGTKVVVAGTGLETIDMKAFLAEAQQSAGGAGKIVG